MALSCGTTCIKYLLFAFNVLVFLFGAVISGFGIYLVVEAKNGLGSEAIGVPAFILTLGLLLFLIGFLGCCGACKEHTCMLKTFAAVVTVLLILQIIAGILAFVYRSKFVGLVADAIAMHINQLDSLPSVEQKEMRKALDKVQKELKCCGGYSSADWGEAVPSSCCAGETSPCRNPYQQGCAQATYDLIKDKALIVGIILIVMAILQLGAIISACCLATKIKEQ
ncbi:unnamed protein product [Dibothriocephalus latus]|uniref:Tetraspanin n=1 Tax=Dibothriocephalus latus TaxID=60516 RepID=A0A3P7LD44_DIBLA|nr:unnamed protein product [Dibothriocephalus latus]